MKQLGERTNPLLYPTKILKVHEDRGGKFPVPVQARERRVQYAPLLWWSPGTGLPERIQSNKTAYVVSGRTKDHASVDHLIPEKKTMGGKWDADAGGQQWRPHCANQGTLIDATVLEGRLCFL